MPDHFHGFVLHSSILVLVVQTTKEQTVKTKLKYEQSKSEQF